MAINFNSGLGMQGGGVSQMSAQTGSVMQGLKAKYGCEDCFRKTPEPPAYTMPVMPVPIEVYHPSFVTRIKTSLLGN